MTMYVILELQITGEASQPSCPLVLDRDSFFVAVVKQNCED